MVTTPSDIVARIRSTIDPAELAPELYGLTNVLAKDRAATVLKLCQITIQGNKIFQKPLRPENTDPVIAKKLLDEYFAKGTPPTTGEMDPVLLVEIANEQDCTPYCTETFAGWCSRIRFGLWSFAFTDVPYVNLGYDWVDWKWLPLPSMNAKA
jgi:hypothetical protein